MKKSNGYSHKNYLIESASKATLKACIYAAFVSSVVCICIVLLMMRGSMFDRSEALIMIPVAFIIWLAGWWIMFDRMVTYAHWLAWYEDYHPPTPPEESVSRNYYQDKGGDWVLISGEPIVGWGGKTGKNGKDKS